MIMLPGTIVLTPSKKRGVVISDNFGCCHESETMVVLESTDYGQGIPTLDLEPIGTYVASPDPKRCGASLGKKCCIYLTAGAQGFVCERFGSLRDTLIFRTMEAKRRPGGLFPLCLLD